MALEDQHDTYMKQIMEKLLLLIPLDEPPPFHGCTVTLFIVLS